jgi:predicted chitinase
MAGDAWNFVSDCSGGGSKTEEVVTYEEYCCEEMVVVSDPDAGCVLDKYFANGQQSFDEIMEAPWAGRSIHAVFSDAYNELCTALEDDGFSNFAAAGTDEQNKREIAAFLANVAVETAYLQDTAQMANYESTDFGIGRGAIQLTHDFNYQAAADYLNDQSIMMDPRLVATDPQLVWKTALWFWLHYINPSVAAPNNCHAAILAGDFGKTLRIIKGDCGSLEQRLDAYNKAISLLGTTGGTTTCSQ